MTPGADSDRRASPGVVGVGNRAAQVLQRLFGLTERGLDTLFACHAAFLARSVKRPSSAYSSTVHPLASK